MDSNKKTVVLPLLCMLAACGPSSDSMPFSCSRNIVTETLTNHLGFINDRESYIV